MLSESDRRQLSGEASSADFLCSCCYSRSLRGELSAWLGVRFWTGAMEVLHGAEHTSLRPPARCQWPRGLRRPLPRDWRSVRPRGRALLKAPSCAPTGLAGALAGPPRVGHSPQSAPSSLRRTGASGSDRPCRSCEQPQRL